MRGAPDNPRRERDGGPASWSERLVTRVADVVTRHAVGCLVAAVLLAGLALMLASSHLRFSSSYVALLPQDAPEVRNCPCG